MSHMTYRSSKANQPSVASPKTRKAMMARIVLRAQANQLPYDDARMLHSLAMLGHVSRAAAYGYHPTKKAA